MDKEALAHRLGAEHDRFLTYVRSFGPEELTVSRNGKWTLAQHVEHIRLSTAPVAFALLVPKWLLVRRYGVPNRPGRTYEGLVQRYNERLAAGGLASAAFIPAVMVAQQMEGAAQRIERNVARMCSRLRYWSEHDLDRVLLPHPLLGKLTVREMLYFTIHHVQHHHGLVQRDPVARG